MRTSHKRISAIFAVALLAAPASAQQATQAQIDAVRRACPGDYQTYCRTVPTGGPAALNCLKQNMPRLSVPCQRAVGALAGAPTAPPTAAAPPPTAAAPPPTAAAPAAPMPAPAMSPRQEAFLLRQYCGPDFRRYCSGVPFGGGRVLACLEGNADRLSARCGGALAAMRQGR